MQTVTLVAPPIVGPTRPEDAPIGALARFTDFADGETADAFNLRRGFSARDVSKAPLAAMLGLGVPPRSDAMTKALKSAMIDPNEVFIEMLETSAEPVDGKVSSEAALANLKAYWIATWALQTVESPSTADVVFVRLL